LFLDPLALGNIKNADAASGFSCSSNSGAALPKASALAYSHEQPRQVPSFHALRQQRALVISNRISLPLLYTYTRVVLGGSAFRGIGIRW